jgi:septal ring factor EnvC (AmiA/AmiB activator)
MTSSRRFKEEIKPMDKASEALLSLQPVTFRYKKEVDPEGNGKSQCGLVAEDVEKVNPDLVVRDKEGKPYGVRYDQVNAMLLNEFLKEHKTVRELKATAAKQEATIARQREDFEAAVAEQKKEIQALTATTREQAEQIQKVSARLEVTEPRSRTVLNNPQSDW